MKPDPEAEGRRWFRQADRDIDDARYGFAGRRFNLACFMSQQAADYDKEFGKLKELVSPLDKYYIPIRYPNGLPGGIPSEAFDKVDAERAMSLAEETIEFVRGKLADGAG